MGEVSRAPWPRLSEQLEGPKAPDRCQACGGIWQEVIRWREHDHDDRPTAVVVVLCNGCSKRLIGPHPRLYSELDRFEHHPGSMDLCVSCRHRDGVSCRLSESAGGPGVAMAPGPMVTHFKAARPVRSGLYYLWARPVSCSGRQTLEVVGLSRRDNPT